MDIESIFGRKEIISGPMASGKSFELIRRLHKYKPFAKKHGYEIICFKSKLDNRRLNKKDQETIAESSTEQTILESRAGLTYDQNVISIYQAEDILRYAQERSGRKILAIEECQLLDSKIISVTEKLRKEGNYVIVCGLNKDYRNEYFMFSDFKADMEDYIETFEKEHRTSLTSICECCGKSGECTQRLCEGTNQPAPYHEPLIKIGADDYQARCREHHECPGKRDVLQAALYLCRHTSVISVDLQKHLDMPHSQQIIDLLIEEKIAKYDDTRLIFCEGPRTERLLGS